MESRVNYTAVGVFVVLFGVLLVSFAFWLGKHNQDDRNYRRYHVYITESVSGLAPEASVKFHGVDVGLVETIRINPRNSEEVELTLKIKKETPIKTDSRAVLKFYGITGLAFIEIVGGSRNAPLLSNGDSKIATIPASLSLITRLDESLSNVAAKLSVTLDHADRLFNDRNVENVALTLEHLRSLSAQIDGYQRDVKTMLKRGIDLEANATTAFTAIRSGASSLQGSADAFNERVLPKAASTLASLDEASVETRRLIQKIEASLDRGDYNLRSAAAPASAELGELIEQTRTLSLEMEQTLRSLRESPSDLLFKTSTPNPGPGE